MRYLDPDLAAVLMNASRNSLQELTIAPAPARGLREAIKPLQDCRNDTDDMPYMQSLRTITFDIFHPSFDGSTWPSLDDAVVILDLASAGSLALNVEFSSPSLLQIANDLPSISEHPSLRLFEQSIVRLIARQTAVSFSPKRRRKNRDGFWTPALAKAFPLLYRQGRLRESSK